jgi:integrase
VTLSGGCRGGAPRNFTKEFARRAALLGFEGFTFDHLRGTHATLLLDHGVPVHTLAERMRRSGDAASQRCQAEAKAGDGHLDVGGDRRSGGRFLWS